MIWSTLLSLVYSAMYKQQQQQQQGYRHSRGMRAWPWWPGRCALCSSPCWWSCSSSQKSLNELLNTSIDQCIHTYRAVIYLFFFNFYSNYPGIPQPFLTSNDEKWHNCSQYPHVVSVPRSASDCGDGGSVQIICSWWRGQVAAVGTPATSVTIVWHH